MHVNNAHPNILQDKRAAANGRDLRDRNAHGKLVAKRHEYGYKRSYPYASVRQSTRKSR